MSKQTQAEWAAEVRAAWDELVMAVARGLRLDRLVGWLAERI